MRRTQQLHQMRVRLLSYKTLLTDFYKSVVFLINTSNPNNKPAMSDRSHNPYPYRTINLLDNYYSTSHPVRPQWSRSSSPPPIPWSSQSENDKGEGNEHGSQVGIDVNDAQEQGASSPRPEEVADGSEVEEGAKMPKPVPHSKQDEEEANEVGEQDGADRLEGRGHREGAPQEPEEDIEASHSLGAAETDEGPWKEFTPSCYQAWGPDATINYPTQHGLYRVPDANTKVRNWMGDNGGDNGGSSPGRKKLEQEIFRQECKRLLEEIIVLKESISTRNERIKDVMNMVGRPSYSEVVIDSELLAGI